MKLNLQSGIPRATSPRMQFQAKLAKVRSEINEIRQSNEHESMLANKVRSKLVSLKNDTGIERTELETLAKEEAFAIVKGQQSEQNKQTYLIWLSKEFTIDSYETLKDKVATENRAKLSTEIAPASSSSSSSSNARPGEQRDKYNDGDQALAWQLHLQSQKTVKDNRTSEEARPLSTNKRLDAPASSSSSSSSNASPGEQRDKYNDGDQALAWSLYLQNLNR